MTSRSRFLIKALRAYETRNFMDLQNFIIDLEADKYSEGVEGFSPEENQVLDDMGAEILDASGKRIMGRRISVSPQLEPDFANIIQKHLKRLSPEHCAVMEGAFLNALEELSSRSSATHNNSEDCVEEPLDARYARELVELLPQVVGRASRLQELEIDKAPNASVQRYFEEAHRCYFFGLNRACIVLCGAMLEAALKQRLGIQARTHELLDAAVNLLDGERLACVTRIMNARDTAVHREYDFERRYGNKDIEEFLLNTRKILEDLYREARRAQA